MPKYFALLLLFATQVQAQVLDINGDNVVGPHEAIAVKEQWKGPASAPNDHDHLGQTWSPVGTGRPLIIRGNFPRRSPFIPIPLKEKGLTLPQPTPQAPLILDNTSTSGHGLIVTSENVGASITGRPTLSLGGVFPVIAATAESNPTLNLRSNGNVQIVFDYNGADGNTFAIAGPNGLVGSFRANGDLLLIGQVTKSSAKTISDHPLDPANKYLTHTSVDSPEMLNVYSGNVVLGETGEAWVDLPSYFEAYNRDYRYHLTCVGGYAPVYVADEIENNRFRISGGPLGLKVSWQVTGVRDDPYAKAHPLEVEKTKSDKEKGKFLHPELFAVSNEKSIPHGRMKSLNPERNGP
ncbi:MAG: hypothetical protein KC978_11775 [Candidatus Omnitrophica bacterium]|nr:hypothetical protein [Candidatus Omnitrophota bacterium]